VHVSYRLDAPGLRGLATLLDEVAASRPRRSTLAA
jgi:hypothetical protein